MCLSIYSCCLSFMFKMVMNLMEYNFGSCFSLYHFVTSDCFLWNVRTMIDLMLGFILIRVENIFNSTPKHLNSLTFNYKINLIV